MQIITFTDRSLAHCHAINQQARNTETSKPRHSYTTIMTMMLLILSSMRWTMVMNTEYSDVENKSEMFILVLSSLISSSITMIDMSCHAMQCHCP